MRRPTRRRFFALVAAAGLSALPRPARRVAAQEWRGSALGGEARIVVDHPDPALARQVAARALDEIDRLENEFSLFRADSALSRLNRDGRLPAPSLDMRRLVAEARNFGRLSDGLFDVSVQPLWQAINEAERSGADGYAGIQDARRLVDWRKIGTNDAGVVLGAPEMALTFNGIAQGYITDRVAAVLSAAGFRHVLVDAGETRATGPRRDGTPWRIGIGDGRVLDLPDGALATSSGGGSPFNTDGSVNHLIYPASGRSPPPARRATVVADDATTADALATILCLGPPGEARRLLKEGGGRGAVLAENDGSILRFRV